MSRAGQRYIVCSKDQYSTKEVAEMAVASNPAAAAAGIDLAAWEADTEAQKMAPVKPATNNSKVCQLLGVKDLISPSKSISDAIKSLLKS